jgi:hypothetical protein
MDSTSPEAIEAAIDFVVATLLDAGADVDLVAIALQKKAIDLWQGKTAPPPRN